MLTELLEACVLFYHKRQSAPAPFGTWINGGGRVFRRFATGKCCAHSHFLTIATLLFRGGSKYNLSRWTPGLAINTHWSACTNRAFGGSVSTVLGRPQRQNLARTRIGHISTVR